MTPMEPRRECRVCRCHVYDAREYATTDPYWCGNCHRGRVELETAAVPHRHRAPKALSRQ